MHVFLAATIFALTPSALASSHGAYAGATVSVSGVVERIHYGRGRHAYAAYDLCDASANCVRVVHFGAAVITPGEMQTATGMFRRTVFVGDAHVQNAIVIGPRR